MLSRRVSKASVGLDQVDNTSDATKNAASVTLTNKTLTDPRVNTIRDVNGNVNLDIWADGSAVNYLAVSNRGAGAPPYFGAQGSDTNIDIGFTPKGTGKLTLWSSAPVIFADGPGGNNNFNLQTVGTGKVQANGVDVTTISDSQTLTNKTLSGSNNTLTALPYDLSVVAFGAVSARVVGTGDFPFGIKLQRACTLTSVTYRCVTADASGDLIVELRKNGSAVSGSSATIAAASQITGGTSTGTWSFAVGDILTVYVTAVGTTPGNGLIADITGITA